MARKKSRERRPRRARPAESYEPAAELSLEEILEEYRAQQQPEPEPEPEPEILDLEPEEESLLTGELTTEEPTDEAPEPPAEEAPPAPEASAGGPPAEKPYPAADTTRKSSVPLAEIEGYDEQDDFYAGFSGENASDDTPEEEPLPDDEEPDDADEEETAEDTPFFRRRNLRAGKPGVKPAAKSGGGLWGKLVGLLAVASLRAEQRKNQPPPEPEDAEVEMEPRQAARHYA